MDVDFKNLSDGQAKVLNDILSGCLYLDFCRRLNQPDDFKLMQASKLGFLRLEFEAEEAKQKGLTKKVLQNA